MNEQKPEQQPAGEPATGAARPEATPPGGAPQPQPATGAAAGAPGADAAPSAADTVVAQLRSEVADLKDRLLRAHAEMDNIRKRTDREKSDAHKYAVTKFARDIVNVGDNFQRAIESVPAGAAEQSAALKSFLEGVTMTERELANTLERHGIKRVDPKGQPFNPHLHQAVMEQPNPDVPAGTVTQVFQPGYTIEDRVLRPAMVVVARGGFKPVKPAADAARETAANDDHPGGGAGGPQA